MTSSRKNKTIYIDKEAASALELCNDGLLYPATHLMNKKESEEVLKTGLIDGKIFPFPFILAPSGKRNKEIIESLSVGEEVTLVCDKKPYATMIIEEVFAINPNERTKVIYGTDDLSHPGVISTIKRIGELAISGKYTLLEGSKNIYKDKIKELADAVNAKHISSLFMAANPLHRAHEKLIRQTLENTDLLVIFLLKPYDNTNLNYEVRHQSLDYFVTNFLPRNRVIIVPLENSYIFAGYNELILDAIVANNYGCNRLTIGRNHAGLGMFYDANANKSIIDRIVGIDIEILISSEYVYCDRCRTLVSKNTCPHGHHHQIAYYSESILELLLVGILPPSVLVRKEISAPILAELFPERFKNLEKLYYDLLPVSGLLEKHTEKDFYIELMNLYQTTSLT